MQAEHLANGNPAQEVSLEEPSACSSTVQLLTSEAAAVSGRSDSDCNVNPSHVHPADAAAN